MEYAMKCSEFISMLKKAVDVKTLYVWSAFGAPATARNKERYAKGDNAKRADAIRAADRNTFFFDCCGLIKGIVWGWNADLDKTYGGAVYKANGVLDYNAQGLINSCPDASADFKNIMPGEMLWIQGHCGVYIGDGLAIESTPSWKNGVQITAVANIGKKAGYNSRKWTKHGHLPFIDYEEQEEPEEWTPAVGDTVFFFGETHYTNANALIGKSCKPGIAKITAIYRLGKSKHPYDLLYVKGGGSTVHGWVNEGTFRKA